MRNDCNELQHSCRMLKKQAHRRIEAGDLTFHSRASPQIASSTMNPVAAARKSGTSLVERRTMDADANETTSSVPPITVIIPVYNEISTISKLLCRVTLESTLKDIVIVDDGSFDGTSRFLEDWMVHRQNQSITRPVRQIAMLRHAANKGKGAAIRTALQLVQTEYAIVQDGDLEVSPDEYPWLIKPLEADEADFVIGYRTQSSMRTGRLAYGAGIYMMNLLVCLLYRVAIRDEACCFKVLRTRDLRRMQLQCNRFEFCPEVVAKAARLGLRFAEIPIAYTPRDSGGGKKLRLRDGIQAMWTLWKFRRWRPE